MHPGNTLDKKYSIIFILVGIVLLTTFSCGCAGEEKGNEKYIQEGINQYNAGNYKDALWSFERYLIDDENSTTAGYAWGWKGITYEELEKYDQALNCIDRAIHISPNDPNLWRARQRILLQLDRVEEAAWAGQKAASLENPSLTPLPTFTTLPPSPTLTPSPFTEMDRNFVMRARNQTERLSELASQASVLTPDEYGTHGALFQTTATRFLQEIEKIPPDHALLIQSWNHYRDALRGFGEAGLREERAGEDFEANNFTAMSTALQEAVGFMAEGNAELAEMMELIDQSGFDAQ
jgi:tetratricopeptide (TPR) repeat protein